MTSHIEKKTERDLNSAGKNMTPSTIPYDLLQHLYNRYRRAEENEHKKKEITRLVGIYIKGTDRLGEL